MKLIIMTISWVQFSGIKYIHGVPLWGHFPTLIPSSLDSLEVAEQDFDD